MIILGAQPRLPLGKQSGQVHCLLYYIDVQKVELFNFFFTPNPARRGELKKLPDSLKIVLS